jgi:hypothetical protein
LCLLYISHSISFRRPGRSHCCHLAENGDVRWPAPWKVIAAFVARTLRSVPLVRFASCTPEGNTARCFHDASSSHAGFPERVSISRTGPGHSALSLRPSIHGVKRIPLECTFGDSWHSQCSVKWREPPKCSFLTARDAPGVPLIHTTVTPVIMRGGGKTFCN